MDPQHWTEPSSLTPQVWMYPTLTEVNFPSGGLAWPASSPRESLLEPQHWMEPLSLTPQVWANPALTERNFPSGGVAWPAKMTGSV